MTDLTPPGQILTWRDRFRHYYHAHELKLEVLMFCAGFTFDIIATGEGVGDPKMIVQQLIYLTVIGFILYQDLIREARGGEPQFSPRIERLWDYRGLALHFCLGTLMNIYSIFFLLSASFFSSILFVVLLFGALIVNEMKAIRKRGADVKVALYVVCVFCFASLMFPLLFHYVGLLPFFSAFLVTVAMVALFHRRLRKRIGPEGLKQKLLIPGFGVCALFLALYLVKLIPPVPISAKKMGIYHNIVQPKDNGTPYYFLYHERPWWKFWQRGDESFVARPGDKLWFFAAISSPASFMDKERNRVFVRWSFHGPKGWNDSDRISVTATGGRKEGYRIPLMKANYDYGDGDWRVSVETPDGREIGRLYFHVDRDVADANRTFEVEQY